MKLSSTRIHLPLLTLLAATLFGCADGAEVSSPDEPSSGRGVGAKAPTIPSSASPPPPSPTGSPSSAASPHAPSASAPSSPPSPGAGSAPPPSPAVPSGGSATNSAVPSFAGAEYAPYFYTWGWGNPAYPFAGLADLHDEAGVVSVTLAFVLSDGGCRASTEILDHQADVSAFRQAGGKLKASFGGANGTYLENACADSNAMTQAIVQFVTQSGIDDLDFDVEQAAAMNPSINEMRARALAKVQRDTGARIAFTLAAFPEDKWGTKGGMSAESVKVVQAALDAGVRISHVNLMTMDYGSYFSDGNAMGQLAISALSCASDQLRSMIAGLTDQQAWHMLGAIPMIGMNDVSNEIFGLSDARALTDFARSKELGLLSFWAINRDQPGDSLATSSGVTQQTFDFHHIFSGR